MNKLHTEETNINVYKKHHYVYQITNLINGKIYVGKRTSSVLPELDNEYMGSGKLIKKAILKYDLENFKKEILKEFKIENDAYNYEKVLVNEEFVKRDDTYNMTVGGFGWASGFATVKDKKGNVFIINITDERFLNNEFVGHTKGKFPAKDILGNFYMISKEDERFLNGDLIHPNKGTVGVIKKFNDKIFRVNINDEKYLSGELYSPNKGKTIMKDNDGNLFLGYINNERFLNGEITGWRKGSVLVKDKDNNILLVSINDKRYLSGELTHINKGKVVVKDKNDNIFQVDLNDERYLSGEVVSIHKGKILSDEIRKKYSDVKNNVKKKIIQKTLNGETVKIFNSIKETKLYGFDPPTIINCCKGKRKTHKKYIWEYYKK